MASHPRTTGYLIRCRSVSRAGGGEALFPVENVDIAVRIPSFFMQVVYTTSELNKIFIFIGTFDKTEPPKQQLEEAQALLDVSVKSKKLSSDYILVAHMQVSQTDSPGEALFKILKTWPHWKDCYMESC